jgi:Zn-dependent M32 family carboxypeptidase
MGEIPILKAIDAAKKILPKEAKFPKPRTDLAKVYGEVAKPKADFTKARQALEATIEDFENAADKVTNALNAYADILDGSDFGLDKKDPKQKKQIDDAQAIIKKGFADSMVETDWWKTTLGKLDKLVADLQKVNPDK